MSLPPRATQSGSPKVVAVQAVEIDACTIEVPTIGTVIIDQAVVSNVAIYNDDTGAKLVAFISARPPCGCGCGEKTGRGLIVAMPPEEARRVARQLVENAEVLEQAAAKAATAILAKAARK